MIEENKQHPRLIIIYGGRASGKTTLLRNLFQNHLNLRLDSNYFNTVSGYINYPSVMPSRSFIFIDNVATSDLKDIDDILSNTSYFCFIVIVNAEDLNKFSSTSLSKNTKTISTFIESKEQKEYSGTTERPSHYGGEANPFEAIKIIEYYNLNFSMGNALKYILRADFKGVKKEDLIKAKQYLEFEIARIERDVVSKDKRVTD